MTTPALTAEQCKTTCGDGGFNNCSSVPCPCGCGGKLLSDGRNTLETLTFLRCDTCGCAYVADDAPKGK